MRASKMTGLVMLLVGLALGSPSVRAQDGEQAGTSGLQLGVPFPQFLYESCYEHVGAFRLPPSYIDSLVGSELPTGFAYQRFDAGLAQLNVVGLACEQGGREVTDLLANVPMVVPSDFGGGRPTLLRVRTYTNSPESLARYSHGLFCFDDNVRLAEVTATVEVRDTGAREGHVFATDGSGSIELTTAVPSSVGDAGAATLQHFTVEDGRVQGRIEWGAGTARRQGGMGAFATLRIDGITPDGLVLVGAQHIYPAQGESLTFFHRGLASCAHGLDGR